MTDEDVLITCWQCSDHNINFTFVLNVISELKEDNISATLKNIEARLNIAYESIDITSDLLKDILDYAMKHKYIGMDISDNNLSYCINKALAIKSWCTLCGEKLEAYVPQHYVDINTFGSFVDDIIDLKQYMYDKMSMMKDGGDETSCEVPLSPPNEDIYEMKSIAHGEDTEEMLQVRGKEDQKRLLDQVKEKGNMIGFLLEFLHNKSWHHSDTDLLMPENSLDINAESTLAVVNTDQLDNTNIFQSVNYTNNCHEIEQNNYLINEDSNKSIGKPFNVLLAEDNMSAADELVTIKSKSILENVIKNKISGSLKNISWNFKLCNYYEQGIYIHGHNTWLHMNDEIVTRNNAGV